MHVCQAVCCKLKFPLSAAEADAGRLKWDLRHQYVTRHAAPDYVGTHTNNTTVCRG